MVWKGRKEKGGKVVLTVVTPRVGTQADGLLRMIPHIRQRQRLRDIGQVMLDRLFCPDAKVQSKRM